VPQRVTAQLVLGLSRAQASPQKGRFRCRVGTEGALPVPDSAGRSGSEALRRERSADTP